MMTRAGNRVSNTVSRIAQFLGRSFGIDLITNFDVGIQLTFTQPDAWYSKQEDEKTTSAEVVGSLLIVIGLCIGASAIYEQTMSSYDDQRPDSYFAFQQKDFQRLMSSQDLRDRESTKPTSLKFMLSGLDGDSGQPAFPDQEGSHDEILEYSHITQHIPEPADSKHTFGLSIMNDLAICFSPSYNFSRLTESRPFKSKYTDLE